MIVLLPPNGWKEGMALMALGIEAGHLMKKEREDCGRLVRAWWR